MRLHSPAGLRFGVFLAVNAMITLIVSGQGNLDKGATQPPDVSDKSASSPANDNLASTLTTSSSVSKVRLVSSLLDVAVAHQGKVIGRIRDVAFDLDTSQLALLVVGKGEASQLPTLDESRVLEKLSGDKSKTDLDSGSTELLAKGDAVAEFLLFPFVDIDQTNTFEWRDDQTITRLPQTVTRAVAQKAYSAYDRDIYWTRYLKELKNDLSSQFDERNFELATFSLLNRRGIIDAEGEAVGKLVDLAIDPSKGDILYCVIQCTDDELRAIPLGAFVMPKDNYRWRIELTREQILAFPSMDVDVPPVSVERGWEEYVAVRYGRAGLQTSPKLDNGR